MCKYMNIQGEYNDDVHRKTVVLHDKTLQNGNVTLFPVTFPLERSVLHHVPSGNVPFRNTYRFVTVTVL